MLTNKDIIKALNSVGYTIQEISNWTQINIDTLKKMKRNIQVDQKSENQLNNFLRMNIEEVEINKFEDKDYRKTHLILTPNGFKKCKNYKNVDKQKCIKVSFRSFDTIVNENHEFQLNNKWVKITQLKIGDRVKVFDEEKEIISIENIDNIDCCDINIDGSYYIDGVVVK